jgi:hypothetical protein
MAMPAVTVLVAIGVGTGANGLITHLVDVNSATAAIARMIDADRQLELKPPRRCFRWQRNGPATRRQVPLGGAESAKLTRVAAMRCANPPDLRP